MSEARKALSSVDYFVTYARIAKQRGKNIVNEKMNEIFVNMKEVLLSVLHNFDSSFTHSKSIAPDCNLRVPNY